MSASIDRIDVYPNVAYLQSYSNKYLSSCSATFGTYSASSTSCSGSDNKVTCTATFDFGSGFTPNNTELKITCSGYVVFDVTITCTAQLAGTTTIILTEQSS